MSTELGAYVEPQRTLVSFDSVYEAYSWALKTLSGATQATDKVIALAMAKSALESGHWRAMFNWNFGNFKVGKWRGNYTCITLNEVLERKKKRVTVWFAPEGELSGNPANGGKLVGTRLPVPPGHPQTRMRAFANRFDGASWYFDAMMANFPNSTDAMFTGDARKFVAAMKRERYFTADEAPYAAAVESIHKDFITKLRKRKVEVVPYDPADLTVQSPDKQALATACINLDVSPIALCVANDPLNVEAGNHKGWV